MRRVLGQKVCCQLVTTPSDTTVNSSHDFRVWRVDHVVPKSQHCPLVFFLKFISGVSYKGWYAIRSSISYQVPWMAVDFNAILQKPVAFVFSGHHTDWKMSCCGRKRSLEDTEESREAGVCVLHFKESTAEHFTFLAKVKEPEARWINLLKIRDDRRSPAGSPHRMDSICDQIPESLSPFHGYHHDGYQCFISNLSSLIPQQGPTSDDAPRARQSRRDSATKDCSIFKTRLHFLQWWGKEEGEETNHDKLRRTVQEHPSE